MSFHERQTLPKLFSHKELQDGDPNTGQQKWSAFCAFFLNILTPATATKRMQILCKDSLPVATFSFSVGFDGSSSLIVQNCPIKLHILVFILALQTSDIVFVLLLK